MKTKVKHMQEFLAVMVSFLIIPILSKRKIPVGIAICICAVIMAFLGGLGAADFGNVISDTFLNFEKLKQFVVIAEISVIGVLLKKYGIIDKMLDSLLKVIESKRMVMMFIPALIGMLNVPGGAIMSAPLIDQLGEKSDLSKSHRAIINLIYRHAFMNIMPYTIGFLVVSSLAPRISIYKLIGLNSFFVVMYVIIGYFLYVRQVQNDTVTGYGFKWTSLLGLLKYTSPIYAAVLLNLMLGIPFYLGMLVNLLIIYLLYPTKRFLTDSARAFSFNVLYALIGVYLIQGIIGRMDSLTSFLNLILANPSTAMLGIAAATVFFGSVTGFQPTALGVIIPIIITLPLSENTMLLYCHFTFIWSFVGYLFSPLHLCQLFTCEYMKVDMIDLYKEYRKFLAALVAVLVVNYFVMGLLVR